MALVSVSVEHYEMSYFRSIRELEIISNTRHTCNTHAAHMTYTIDRHTGKEHTGRPCYISWLLQKTVVNAINLPKKTEVVSKKPKLEEKIY